MLGNGYFVGGVSSLLTGKPKIRCRSGNQLNGHFLYESTNDGQSPFNPPS